MRHSYVGLLISMFLAAGCSQNPDGPQFVISANDNRFDLAYGAMRVLANPEPDTVTILNMAELPPEVVHLDDIPNSVLGPPTNAAITPDQRLALVANSMIIDPDDPAKQIPDRTIHMIDLTADPPVKIGEAKAGRQPSGFSISPDGRLALVANRADGTISVFAIDERTLRSLDTVAVGTESSEVSHVAISPDGKLALASKRNDNAVAVLRIDGQTVVYTGRDVTTGVKPYALEISSDGEVAVVANSGDNRGDADTAAIIDLTISPPRVVNHVTVGIGPEHVTISPDGRLVAFALMNGSNLPADHPFRTERGLVRLFRRRGTRLAFADEALVGAIPEGVAFTNDGRYLLVQNYVDRTISIFRVFGDVLRPTGHVVDVPGQPAAIRAATLGVR